MEPEQEKAIVDRVVAKFPDREVRAIEIEAGKETLLFVLTAPDRDEWKKYRSEMRRADGDPDGIETAIERAALAQIRYPEREQAQAVFNRKPGIIASFAGVLADLVGVDSEAREKKF